MLDELMVYGVVACATTYATWRLMPGALRVALAECCSGLAQRIGLAEADPEATRRRANASGNSACGGCSGCANKQMPPSVVIVSKANTKDR